MKGTKHIFYFILFFAIIYGENFSVGAVPFALLWKFPLLIGLLWYILHLKRSTRIYFGGKGILLTLEKNLNTSLSFGIGNIVEIVKGINLSLFTYFLINYYKYSRVLKIILKSLAFYTIISFVPFTLGLISSVSSGVNAEIFGGESGIMGVFSSAHNAAVSLSVSILVLIFFFSEFNTRTKILVGLLIMYALYILLFTYTRTGLIALIISLIYYFVKNSVRINFFQILLAAALIAIPVYYIVSNNESIQNKILDKRDAKQELTAENAGSGRFVIWGITISNWMELDPIEKALGIGPERALERMRVKIGKPFFSHNEFLDVLIRNGLVGLALYLLYLRAIYLFIRQNSIKGGLSMPIYLSYLTILLFQGGHFFIFEVFFAFAIVYDYKHKYELEHKPA